MNKIFSTLLLMAGSVSIFASETMTVTVQNPVNAPRNDVPVVLPLSDYGIVRSAVVTLNGQEIPCQLDDLDQDEVFDELCFLADFDQKGQKQYQVTLSADGEPRTYPARVYAEMVMANTKDKKLKKHQQNNYIESITARGDAAYTYNLQHHHGVDFESELNGIRIYFDARQTLDLYGKFKKQLELKDTQFYTTDEQKAQGYGDDVLWVGQTFGLGAFRGWDGQQPTLVEPVRTRTQRIISYGPLRTIVEVIDRGWKADKDKAPVNMTLRYTQYAGHRDTDVDVFFNKDVSDYRFSTGIWKRETVGLAVLVAQENIVSEEPANKDNYAYVLRVNGRHMAYKVTYTSANETFGYHSAKEWFEHLVAWKKTLQPVTVSIVKKK